MFERRHEPLLPRPAYVRRVVRGTTIGLLIIAGSLGVGVIGYHITEHMSWLDALLNASMILFGEGPPDIVETNAGKWFASFYAMFSGVAFITIVGVMFGPVVHRVFHRFHLEADDEQRPSRKRK